MQRNERFAGLKAGYLFPEVSRRRALFQASHPDAKLISLGVGNTTEPITPHICGGLAAGAERLGTMEGYTGYGDEQGLLALRERIAEVAYEGKVAADEVFVSDGAKCDIGRLQILFGACKAVVQDPAYPVYVDGSIIQGAEVSYMPCTRDNGFMPDVSLIPESSVVYFCSPNNPTGAVATKEQLALLVAEALRKRAIIVFDAAYSEYISDPKLPKTIYEIEGAKQCAIEVNSFKAVLSPASRAWPTSGGFQPLTCPSILGLSIAFGRSPSKKWISPKMCCGTRGSWPSGSLCVRTTQSTWRRPGKPSACCAVPSKVSYAFWLSTVS